jgi:two-component system sensor histidine kinase YesM
MVLRKERIQMQYGKEYGLIYVSEPNEGTVVTILFPYNKHCAMPDHE